MNLKQEIEQQLIRLKNDSKNAAVLVEGKKDKLALEKFGIKNIITIKKPLYEIVETISENFSTCILLLDLDREGNKLYKRLKDDLQKHGVKVDSKFRSFLFKHTGLKEIEGLTSFFKHVAVRNYTEIKA
jgi:5S rRNA maturation endonuclease (ribonuclease M5)